VDSDVSPINPSTLRYTRAPHIAREYDRVHANNALFAYDSALLDGWFLDPGRLLDLGCGTGRHVEQFARRGFRVTGVDLSPHMLSLARRRLLSDDLQAQLIEGNMLELDALGLGQYDYALCMFSTLGMVQGYGNRLSFLKAVRRRVAPGGLLSFHVHNSLRPCWGFLGVLWWLGAHAWVLLSRREFGDRIIPSYRSIPDLYVHLFSEGEIRRLLEDSGWRLKELVPLNASRNGPLRGSPARRLRANGFIVLAERPA